MLKLYHFGNAICAQKVRIALAEKGVAWDGVDCAGPGLRDPEYLKLNPNGVVPTLVHDGVVLTESRIISEYIDEAFDGPRLMPADPRERYHARRWSKQVDDSLHLNVFVLSFATAMRHMYLAMPESARPRAMPGLRDPVKRRIANELLTDGLASSWVTAALSRFVRLVAEMEATLSRTSYLAGSTWSLADADYTPYFRRLGDLGLETLWQDKPAVQAWWARMQERPSYKAGIIDWLSPDELQAIRNSRERYGAELRALVPPPV